MRYKLTDLLFNVGFLNICFIFSLYFFSVLSFIIGFSLNQLSLSIFFIIFCMIIFLLHYSKLLNLRLFKISFPSFLFLLIISFLMLPYFSNTYDTSWDGQGYHSAGVISLANKWNPIYQPSPSLDIPDGKIFVAGYPKALWIIQSNIYLMSGSINSAKITNLFIGITAICLIISLLIYMRVNFLFSIAIAVLAVLQTSYVMQFFSFMEDGFVYALFICSIVFLFYYAEKFDKYSFIGYFLSNLVLVSAKFSSLPVVMISYVYLYSFHILKSETLHFILIV